MWLRRSRFAVAHFFRLPLRRKLLYAEVVARFVWAWVLVRGLPYARWKAQLRQRRSARLLDELGPADLAFLHDIQHVFRQIKWATRDRATCLMMVLVARWMLNHRRIPGTIFFGVRRDAAKPGLHAHAWMLSAIGVVGHEDVEPFAIVERITT